MLNKQIKICKILTFNQEDFLSFSLEFASSGVDVVLNDTDKFIDKENFTLIIVGWENVKRLFPSHRISQKKISDKILWVYSVKEEKSTTISNTKKIIKNIILDWLPNVYITYDYILDGNLSVFLNKNFKKPYNLFAFFSGKSMYFYNEKNEKIIIGISLESMKYVGLDIKKSITTIMKKYSPVCLSYSNVSLYITENNILNFQTIENLFWTRYNEEISEKNFYDFMMDTESDRFIPFLLCKLYKTQIIEDYEKKYMDRLIKKDFITDWLSKRELFFDKNYINENIFFKKSKDNINYTKLLYSNKRTITGRINCIDRRFNPQMLSREGEDRKMIISRFKNGKIVVFDYVSFETKISLFLSQDEKFIKKFKDKDLHEETAKVIFEKKEVNTEERSVGKSINHTLIYGGGDEILKKNIGNIKNTKETLDRVKHFLSPILSKSELAKISFEEIGYIINSFGTIVRPQKMWAVFQNYVQSIAADILVENLYKIKEFDNVHKSKFLFQVHDSFVFDMHPDELKNIDEIKKILSNFKNINLQVKASVGNNFSECT